MVFLKFKGECSALKSFRRIDFKMNGIDRPFYGEETNYNTLIFQIAKKNIYIFIIFFDYTKLNHLQT